MAKKWEVLGFSALVGNNKEVADADGQGKGREIGFYNGFGRWKTQAHVCLVYLKTGPEGLLET